MRMAKSSSGSGKKAVTVGGGGAHKAALWQARVAAWAASGLTQRAFCAREGLSLSTFDYWRRRHLHGRAGAAVGVAPPAAAKQLPARVRTYPAAARGDGPAPLTLLPLTLEAAACGAGGLILTSPQGWRLTLSGEACPAWLGTLLRQLP